MVTQKRNTKKAHDVAYRPRTSASKAGAQPKGGAESRRGARRRLEQRWGDPPLAAIVAQAASLDFIMHGERQRLGERIEFWWRGR